MTSDHPEGGFGLYLHWPFCAAKCPYCDFNSYVSRSIDIARWHQAYLSEIARVSALTGPRPLSSVYFGGGTPSLMPADLVAAILDAVRTAWPAANRLEVTLEANPGSVEAGRFRDYRAAGVDRVSLGLQALEDGALRKLGRLHSASEGLAALETARSVFDRVSFDLIYARQDQPLEAWEAELGRALDLAPDHLSLYQLTIEPGTAFALRQKAGNLPGLPSDDLAADHYLLTQERTEAAGLPAYEVSNHARSGAESRHNLIYWTGGDYAGIGPGAHGRLTVSDGRVATETVRSPDAWLGAVENAGSGESATTDLDPGDVLAEAVLTGLRLRRGIRLARIEALPGYDALIEAAEPLAGDGFLEVENGYLSATKAGRPLTNRLVAALLA